MGAGEAPSSSLSEAGGWDLPVLRLRAASPSQVSAGYSRVPLLDRLCIRVRSGCCLGHLCVPGVKQAGTWEISIWKERAGPEATGIDCVKFSTYELYKYILYVGKIK